MKNRILYCIFFCLSSCAALTAAAMPNKAAPLGSSRSSEGRLIVHNRILAKINGKPITTHDVVKKMDVSFYRQYPQFVSSIAARYQFYEANWKAILQELINKELVFADAEENKVEISGGEVRKEMETLFGPNMIENLDRAGLTFDEAAKIVQGDLLLRRMLAMRVYGKALRMVTPSQVRKAYEEYIRDPKNIRQNQWHYQVVTVQDRTPKKGEEIANQAFQLLMKGVPLTDLVKQLKDQKVFGRKTKVTVSDVIKADENELSEAYKQVLTQMDTGMYSQPTAQKSRRDNMTVYRIFYVKGKIPGGAPSFKEMEAQLKEQLLDQTSDRETEAYLKKLMQHHHIRNSDLQSMIPPNYQPFTFNQ